ncbi:uncharacterized protein LOC117597409 [Pangasianodon hypophthalmus]|uniref:uncharacterized protein LOC117597409 n=1 Tax=Pangasianodon hypophthalmus TaxID=310915 RepID=UPI0023074A4D|nr:uncharacterized protein LOC117597409 [Pangasianodon hypophthalmus]
MDIITNKKVKLIKWLRMDEYILQHVQSRMLITMEEYTKLKNISDPGTQIMELLDLMLVKGQGVCIDFLDLLKEDDVNEGTPELKEWITSVNTSEIKAAPQSSVQSSGSSVIINARDASDICTPIISGSQISSFSMNVNIDRTLNNLRTPDPLTSFKVSMEKRPSHSIKDNQEFLKRNQGKLIDKVKNVDRITDDLNLGDEMAANVRAERTDQAKMRKLLEYTNSTSAANLLVDALNKHAADVMEDLATA